MNCQHRERHEIPRKCNWLCLFDSLRKIQSCGIGFSKVHFSNLKRLGNWIKYFPKLMAAPNNPRDFYTWTCLNSRCRVPDILGGDQVGMNQNYGHHKEEAGKKDVQEILAFSVFYAGLTIKPKMICSCTIKWKAAHVEHWTLKSECSCISRSRF